MTTIKLLDAKNVAKTLHKLILDHSSVRIAVAWGYDGPVAKLLFLNKHKIASMMVGVAFCQTDPNLLDKLVGVKNAFVADSKSATFHPKIYYFQTGSRAEAIVGSSNFTSGGLEKNWEACVQMTGNTSDPIFFSIRECIQGYQSFCLPITQKIADNYRLQFNAAKAFKKPKNPILNDSGTSTSWIGSELVKLNWKKYSKAIKTSRNHSVPKRLQLLRKCQQIFASAGSFTELTENEWKAIAGTIGHSQSREAGLESYEWAWFGSMKGMGDFAHLIAQQNSDLAQAVDGIPRNGEVTRAHYEVYCENFLRAFDESTRRGGVPTATRLLAMKRPDTFVCISKPNISGLAAALSFPKTTLRLENYWEKVIEPIQTSPWYNSERPSGSDAEIWDWRAAMLDAIYYKP